MVTLTLEEFTEVNDQELTCIFAESGLDREGTFDRDDEVFLLWDHEAHFGKQYALVYTKEEPCNH